MGKKYIAKLTSNNIQIFKELFSTIELLSSDDVNIIFKKEKKIDDSSSSESNKSPVISENDDNDSNDNGNGKKKKKKKYYKKKKIIDSDTDENKDEQKGSMVVKTMSNNQTVISLVKFDSILFSEFYLKNDELSFWMDIKELNKFIKILDPDNFYIMMYVEKSDEKTLKFKVINNDDSERYKTFELGFTDPSSTIGNIPKIDFDLIVSINTLNFRKICSEFNKFSESIEIKCDENKIKFKCTTKYNKPYEDSIPSGKDGVLIKKIKENYENINISYYLTDLLKLKISSDLCDNIIIHLKNKNPLFVHGILKNSDKKINYGHLLIYFSPYDTKIDGKNYHDLTKECYDDKKAIMKS